MASVQFKRGQSGRKTFYVVVSAAGRRTWLKAGTLKDAPALKKKIDSMAASERLEKLGCTSSNQFGHELATVSMQFERWQSFFGSASSSVLEFVV